MQFQASPAARRALRLCSVLSFLLTLTSVASPVRAQELASAIPAGHSARLWSETLQEQRRVFIQLPEGYHTSGRAYPVVYLLEYRQKLQELRVTGPRPPVAPVRNVVDDYFGTKLVDPYRWMESLDGETLDWMKAQGRHTRAVFDSMPARDTYAERVDAFTGAFATLKSYRSRGGRSFYLLRGPGADGFDLYVREAGGETRTLIDIAALTAAHNGIPASIDYFEPSPDGSRVGVGVSLGGSEDAELTVYDVATGTAIAQPLARAAWISWSSDGQRVFVTRFARRKPGIDRYLNSTAEVWDLRGEPVPLIDAALKRGPPIQPQQFPHIMSPRGAGHAALIVVNGVQNEKEIWVASQAEAAGMQARWRCLTRLADQVTQMEMIGDRIFLLSHRNAPTFQVLSVKGDQPLSQAKVVLAARPDRVIESISAAADALYVVSRAGAYSHLIRIPAGGGAAEEIALPFEGDLSEVSADASEPGAVVTLESWVRPPMQLRFDPAKKALIDLKLSVRPQFDPAAFVVTNLHATARDGARVPLTLVRPRTSQVAQPLILYGYGAYGISTLARFRAFDVPFMEEGAAIALCHVRGGGELGEAWHVAGKGAQKPNTWRDLIACGEDLITRGVTTRQLLFIRGGSAGGITVGRAMEVRPDLFAGVIANVPSANQLRAGTASGGASSIPEFGSVADGEGFKNLLAMDSYYNVQDGVQYPPILITTGLNDPRVPPWMPAKFAARLQASGTRAPVLLRIDEQAGHGAASTRSQSVALSADVAAFVFWHAGRQGWKPGPLP